MKSNMRKAVLVCGASTLIAIYSIGCNTVAPRPQQIQAMGDFFPRQGEVHDMQRILNAQAASGARADATLNAKHFDKGELNSLGRQKLALMLDDDDAINPMTVYLNIAEDDEFKATKQDSILAYLKEQGLEEKQVSFKAGPNPSTAYPAAEGLARLGKTETGAAGGAEGGGEAAAEAGMSAK